MKLLLKFLLNNLWGKFCQRPDMAKVMFFNNAAEYFKTVFDPTMEIHNIVPLTDDKIMVNMRPKMEFIGIQRNVNPMIASLITTQGRLMLYTLLDELQERVMYCDTDSVIYYENPDLHQPLKEGEWLGSLQNELGEYDKDADPSTLNMHNRAHITKWVSAGGKNYAYLVKTNTRLPNGKWKKVEVCKVRGFTIKSHMKKKLNYKNIAARVREYVQHGTSSIIDTRQLAIRQKGQTGKRQIVTENIGKKYRVDFTKRQLDGQTYFTLPWGY